VGQESSGFETAEQSVVMNDISESHLDYKSEIAALKAEITVVSMSLIEMKAESNKVMSDISEIKVDIAGVKSDIAEMKNLLQSNIRDIQQVIRMHNLRIGWMPPMKSTFTLRIG